ncbi:RsmB/NOP family class I SAM-dependent RNA methyltransferase [candidate division WOR-3 bacterium]|uniref:RsmB/NOP family class I SAM-dependent RNA methyltransferase n=1 Tax=candidate division WOR-3 bacterium TaxID=2052148 RepID=A0A938BUM4_UNCW3|nr:RsmB/NOP family class I SAM-dependent RNA methyltransferase [candidate division WOR-3 bacterium]
MLKRRFPQGFIDRYSQFIPDFDAFLDAMQRPLRRTFRVNTHKATREQVLGLMVDLMPEPLPWYELGFVLPENGDSPSGREDARYSPHFPALGKRIEHFVGLIYVQEAASMVPPLVLQPQPGERVLDIAAAPGSKTTEMSAMMQNTGLIISNDPSPTRVRGLIGNVDRAGCLNVAVCRMDGSSLGRMVAGTCYRVLVDAPCSSEGTIRKSAQALDRWSVATIERFPSVQKRLILAGYLALKPGGVMVYSTCTVAPEENESVVAHLLARQPEAEVQEFELPGLVMRPGLREWGRESFAEAVSRCRRILPQDNDTEPFFIALIRKGRSSPHPSTRGGEGERSEGEEAHWGTERE